MIPYDEQLLLKTLTQLQVIDKNRLEEAYEQSKKQKISFESMLLSKDLISDENLGRTISDLISYPLVRISDVSIPDDVLALIPEVVARKQMIIAFKKDKEGLSIATYNPQNVQMIDFLKKKVGMPIRVYFATAKDITNALFLYSKDVVSTFDEIIKESIKQANVSTKVKPEPPIIKIVDTILTYAYQNKASDIHIEPLVQGTLVRFRIDGVLHDIVSLPTDLHESVTTRIKVLASLRTDEHHAAQDGKFQFQAEDEEVDVRVSIIPVVGGEKVVMRLLSENSRQFSLADLGFAQKDLEKVKNAYEKPYGMILSTGPTGSGKTTTIYAVLKLLNNRDVNIMTIEDPIEYEIEGVNQIQVNVKTNLTFAEGLKSILRQDPNIILVGEVRDRETADIAINSAMTGHLVLSTLHTNNAATAIPRLLDMGIEPFLVASTVNVVIAQRLVRKIHTRCRISQEIDLTKLTDQFDEKLLQKVFGSHKTIRLYHGKGCAVDHQTGYEGRVGIFEVLIVNEEIRNAILARKDADAIAAIAIKNGMTTMIEDALGKAKEGITTIDEVIRAVKI